MFIAFQCIFHIFVNFGNFLLSGNDMCHSQPILHYLISSNASHSIHLFVVQWRHIPSESAVSLMLHVSHILIYCKPVALNYELHG